MVYDQLNESVRKQESRRERGAKHTKSLWPSQSVQLRMRCQGSRRSGRRSLASLAGAGSGDSAIMGNWRESVDGD